MVKLTRDGMKLVGQEGREIPTPPSMMLSWRSRLASYTGQSLIIAGVLLVGGLLKVDAFHALAEAGWKPTRRPGP